MHPIRVFITPFSAALIGTVLMAAPAPGATDPAPAFPPETAGRLDDRLERAHRAVTAVEGVVVGLEGLPLPAPLAADLERALRAVREAEALAGPAGPLGAALARVRTGLAAAARAPRVTPRVAGLLDDAALTLTALSVNSALLTALGHLETAAGALGKAERGQAAAALDRAEAAIEAASARGGPHVAGDLEGVHRARLALSAPPSGGPAGDPDLEAPMAQVRSHLLEVEVAPH